MPKINVVRTESIVVEIGETELKGLIRDRLLELLHVGPEHEGELYYIQNGNLMHSDDWGINRERLTATIRRANALDRAVFRVLDHLGK